MTNGWRLAKAPRTSLTGLPNRLLFVDCLIVALAQATCADQKLAVFFRPRPLQGHQRLARALDRRPVESWPSASAVACDGDTVVPLRRWFTPSSPRQQVEDVAKIAQKIIETLKIPFVITQQELFVTTSIGISILTASIRNARQMPTGDVPGQDQGGTTTSLPPAITRAPSSGCAGNTPAGL